ncbi:MAG: universal stress protein [Bacteroidales bacterium]|nr:universal stress protein [Bacteroidales bacterium]
MKKKIIQFIRTGENLDGIINTSLSLAEALDMELKLFMVLETRHTFFYPMTSPLKTGLATYEFEKICEERLKEEEKRIGEFVDQKNKSGKAPKISFEIRSGATDLILLDVSEENDTYLIVINEADEPELGFIINTYLQIVEKTGCPILKVNKEFEFDKIKKVLYATDYMEEDVPTLKKLAEMIAPFKASITALHITESVDLEEKLKSHGFEASIHDKTGYDRIEFAVREEKNVTRGVTEYAVSDDFDMIVVLKENRNFLQRLFSRSDSNRILSKSEIPVMVFHQESA